MTQVSIIIPCYNDGKYLREAVASAQAQTHPDVEIIVVDDHSTEPLTHAAYKQLREQGVTVLPTPQGKKGLPAARNAGIAAAAGDYILPLDADDKIAPSYVEKGVAVLEKQAEVGICYCRARLFGLKRNPWKLPPYSWEAMLSGNMIFATALFRKADWRQVGGYDESLVHGLEDYAFWLRIIALGRDVVQIEEELFNYRIKTNSLLASIAAEEEGILAARDVFQSCEPIFRDNVRTLFFTIHKMKKEQNALSSLVSWRLMQPLFRLEWMLRQRIKKAIGRI